jgi:peptidoglycan/xylan/chitin deacetylase (PgdA/CDA1 family)
VRRHPGGIGPERRRRYKGNVALRTFMRDSLWSVAGRSGIAPLIGHAVHSPGSLRVLMYHDVPSELMPIFDSHLNWLMRHFEFLTPHDLLLPGKIGERPKALLTFDDGCLDNYELVAPLLESYGLRGLFFVCPGFDGLSRDACFELMERSSVLLGEKTRDSRWQRMSRQQIVDLERRGHGIGSHTMTHTPLARLEQSTMMKEIRDSATVLESWLGKPCSFFAWTYAWSEISREALAEALRYHPYCFSPCSGVNRWPAAQGLFWRTGIDVSKPVSHLKTQVSGLVDYVYRGPRRELSSEWNSVASADALGW